MQVQISRLDDERYGECVAGDGDEALKKLHEYYPGNYTLKVLDALQNLL